MNPRSRFLPALVAALVLPTAVLWQRPALAQSACVAAPSGLVAWYTGDGSAADIQNAHDGTLANGATFTAGKVGQAFSLDGVDDYVEGPTANVASGALSLSAWVRQETTGGAIISKYNSAARNVSWGLYYTTNGRLRFIVSENGDNKHRYVDTDSPVSTPGAYRHVAATFSAATQEMKIYVDGQQAPATLGAGSAAVGSIFNSGTNVRIGSIIFSEGVLTNFLKGAVDEAQIYNRELTAAEVQNIYNAGGAGVCKPAYNCAAPPSNLTAWFPGDNNSIDLRGGFAGELANEATYAAGKVGQAFKLDGVDDRVQIPDSAGVSMTGALSIEAWVRLDQLTSHPQTFVAKYDYPNQNLSYNFTTNGGGKLTFAVFQNRPDRQNDGRFLDTKFDVVRAGVFTHVAATFNPANQQMKIYVNGVAVPDADTVVSGDPVPAVFDSSRPLYLGAVVDGGHNFTNIFGGLIDEVHLYTRALTAAEIQAIYKAGSAGLCRSCAPPPANLNLWLPFDETLGTSAVDLTNHVSSATLRGGAGHSPVGRVGGALDLSGANGEVKIVPGGAGLDYQDWQQQTISFWINWGGPRTIPQQGVTIVTSRQYVWDNRGTNGEAAAVIVIDEPGHPSGPGLKVIGDPAPGSPNTGGEVQAVAPLPAVGVWEHYTCIFDKASKRISVYKNGLLAGSSPFTGWTPRVGTSAGAKYIGNAAPGGGVSTIDFHLRGRLDEFVVADTAVLPDDRNADLPNPIVDIPNAGSAGVCKALGNDRFASAQVLGGSSGRVAGFNLRASKEAGEPNHAGAAGGASVWYRWQAPFTGAVNFSTVLSDFDTLLAVYTGTSVGALTPVAANDDSASGNSFNTPELTSSVTFNAVAGRIYYIAVDGAQGRAGRISLGWGADVSISGQVSPGHHSVVIELVGDDHRAAPFVSASGTYSFQHLRAGGNYKVRLRSYRSISNVPCFTPPYRTPTYFAPLTGSVANFDFTYLGEGCGSGAGSIAGLVKRSNGVGIPGVKITLSSSSFTLTETTESDGTYDASFTELTTFTVTPSSPNLIFTPASLSASSAFDVLGADFTALDTVTIGGQVRNGGAPLSGATISVSGTRTFSLTTDANGYYDVEVPAGGSYAVTVSRAGVTFAPPSFTLNSLSSSQKNLDFTAASGALRIDAMSRRAVRSAGGQQLTLTGEFANLSQALIGGVSANWSYTNGPGDTTRITVTAPAQAAGAASIDLLPASGAGHTKVYALAYLPTVFTDDTLTAGATLLRAQHVAELRQAADALRAAAGLPVAQWADPVLLGAPVRAAHIRELRARLEEAAGALGLPAVQYTDPDLAAGAAIKRVHVEELRQRVRQIAG